MKIKTLSNMIFRYVKNKYLRIKLKNNNASIIANNCNGSFIMHDLHMKFNTPTVNLFIEAPDFIEFVNNLDFYLKCELEEKQTKENYPIGVLDNKVVIHFLHYESFESAKEKWNIRKKRVDLNNVYIFMTDRDGFNLDTLKAFNEIKYPKVLFSHIDYQNENIIYFPKYKNHKCVGILSNYSGWFGKREYDIFNYVDFLNDN